MKSGNEIEKKETIKVDKSFLKKVLGVLGSIQKSVNELLTWKTESELDFVKMKEAVAFYERMKSRNVVVGPKDPQPVVIPMRTINPPRSGRNSSFEVLFNERVSMGMAPKMGMVVQDEIEALAAKYNIKELKVTMRL